LNAGGNSLLPRKPNSLENSATTTTTPWASNEIDDWFWLLTLKNAKGQMIVQGVDRKNTIEQRTYLMV